MDYHTHAAVLEKCHAELAASSFSEAQLSAAQNQILGDLTVAGDYALLGAMASHLFAHAAATGSELHVLERAADLWQRAVALYAELGGVRTRFETALGDPTTPNAVDQFNAAAMDVQFFAQKTQAMQAEIVSLRDDVRSFAHLPAHPRQSDQPVKSWDWGNLFLGRRTDAFVRSLARAASTPATRAFAFGTLASYGANAAGSAYVGEVVGGPRRTHRFRDRLARNTVGSWMRRNQPKAESPGTLAARLHFGAGVIPTLPSQIEQLLARALKDTFDESKTSPVPNLRQGYRRLIKHLTLLDNFEQPPIPNVPGGVWAATLFADPSNPPPTLRTQDIGFSGDPGGGVSLGNNSQGDSAPGKSDDSTGSTICGIIVAILIIIDLIQAFVQCIVQWAKKQGCTFWDNMLLKKLWEKDPPDPRDPTRPEDIGTDSAGLTAMASTAQVAQLIATLFDIHTQIWEALDRAYHFLALHGLIYPRHLIDLPVYKQFTVMPSPTPWPHRVEADPVNRFHLYPNTPLEHPTVAASAFAAGVTPDALISIAVSRIAMPFWRQLANQQQDSQNMDLDADRGLFHPCWTSSNSVTVDPVAVQILGYDDL